MWRSYRRANGRKGGFCCLPASLFSSFVNVNRRGGRKWQNSLPAKIKRVSSYDEREKRRSMSVLPAPLLIVIKIIIEQMQLMGIAELFSHVLMWWCARVDSFLYNL